MSRSYRNYTEEERAEAVQLATKHGVREAATRLGFPPSSVSRWAALARAEGGVQVADEDEDDSEESLKRAARRYTPSEKAQALEYAAAHGHPRPGPLPRYLPT